MQNTSFMCKKNLTICCVALPLGVTCWEFHPTWYENKRRLRRIPKASAPSYKYSWSRHGVSKIPGVFLQKGSLCTSVLRCWIFPHVCVCHCYPDLTILGFRIPLMEIKRFVWQQAQLQVSHRQIDKKGNQSDLTSLKSWCFCLLDKWWTQIHK